MVVSPLVTFNLPDVGERIATVVITEWYTICCFVFTCNQLCLSQFYFIEYVVCLIRLSVLQSTYVRLVKEGDTVIMGDALCEVQSDKVSYFVSVCFSGVF